MNQNYLRRTTVPIATPPYILPFPKANFVRAIEAIFPEYPLPNIHFQNIIDMNIEKAIVNSSNCYGWEDLTHTTTGTQPHVEISKFKSYLKANYPSIFTQFISILSKSHRRETQTVQYTLLYHLMVYLLRLTLYTDTQEDKVRPRET